MFFISATANAARGGGSVQGIPLICSIQHRPTHGNGTGQRTWHTRTPGAHDLLGAPPCSCPRPSGQTGAGIPNPDGAREPDRSRLQSRMSAGSTKKHLGPKRSDARAPSSALAGTNEAPAAKQAKCDAREDPHKRPKDHKCG